MSEVTWKTPQMGGYEHALPQGYGVCSLFGRVSFQPRDVHLHCLEGGWSPV